VKGRLEDVERTLAVDMNPIDCQECYKIKCGKCGWEPDTDQVILIQNELLTQCPKCNWSPKDQM
jgi:predicted nucleic acid-binding Zn ribbon protein